MPTDRPSDKKSTKKPHGDTSEKMGKIAKTDPTAPTAPGSLKEIENDLQKLWDEHRVCPKCMGVSLLVLKERRFGPLRPDMERLVNQLVAVNLPDDMIVMFDAESAWISVETDFQVNNGMLHGLAIVEERMTEDEIDQWRVQQTGTGIGIIPMGGKPTVQ